MQNPSGFPALYLIAISVASDQKMVWRSMGTGYHHDQKVAMAVGGRSNGNSITVSRAKIARERKGVRELRFRRPLGWRRRISGKKSGLFDMATVNSYEISVRIYLVRNLSSPVWLVTQAEPGSEATP